MDECFFDATAVEPMGDGFEPIPDGEYEVVIVASQMKPTKAGTGSYLELKCQVSAGEYAKRILWTRLNLKNPSTAAVEMAKRELSAICHAVGVLRPKSKDELHNIPLLARVVRADDGRGGFRNEIKGWRAKSATAAASAASATASATPAAATSAPTSAGSRPW